jgi:hypothetical protein
MWKDSFHCREDPKYWAIVWIETINAPKHKELPPMLRWPTTPIESFNNMFRYAFSPLHPSHALKYCELLKQNSGQHHLDKDLFGTKHLERTWVLVGFLSTLQFGIEPNIIWPSDFCMVCCFMKSLLLSIGSQASRIYVFYGGNL